MCGRQGAVREISTVLGRLLAALRRGWAAETGSAGVFVIGAMTVLLAIGFTGALVLGDAVADRRQANTAADASALAAASYCEERLVKAYTQAVAAPDGWEFWGKLGLPVSTYCSGMVSEASAYARANNADLTGFQPDFARLRFTSTVRELSGVEGTSAHHGSSSTATIVPRRGLCVHAGLVGVRTPGGCETHPTLFNPETGEPLRPPAYQHTARALTRLTTP